MAPTNADAERGSEGWFTNYEEALKLAKAGKKLVLADFTGSDWCGWCVRLKAEVFDTPEFEAWAAKHVVLLELDFPQRKQLPAELARQNEMLARKNGIQGYPTILFLDASGKAVGRMGYEAGGPVRWTQSAQRIVDSVATRA